MRRRQRIGMDDRGLARIPRREVERSEIGQCEAQVEKSGRVEGGGCSVCG